MPGGAPRIFVSSATPGHPDAVREAGGEPVVLGLPVELPVGGVVLHREWVADRVEVFCAASKPDAMLLGASEPAELAGLLLAALRLDLPAVVAPSGDPSSVALAALGLVPLAGDAVEAVVGPAETGRPRARELVDNFALANALRAGLSVGAGAELLVHLAAVAREAGVIGFPRMIRVLAPECPEVFDPHPETHDVPTLLAGLGDALHDTRTVSGRLKEALPAAQEEIPAPRSRLVFIRGRASGTEVVCRVGVSATEVSGECRVFYSEEAAVRAVESGGVSSGHLLVVAGCGPRGGPGLLRLDRLNGVMREAGLTEDVPVLTDGLPPEGAAGPWASLAAPEAASGGVIGRLRDGDPLRLDLVEGRIRTGIAADELAERTQPSSPQSSGSSYAARYARSALPALDGAGFG